MSMNQILTEDIRLALLRFLSEGNAYSLNESILHSALGTLGHHISRDRVRSELAWLSEQGLVTICVVVNTQVASLTGRGLDIAAGLAVTPGVKRPSPRG